MPSWTVPSDSHSPGDTGHTTDHNHIVDDLTLVNDVVPVVSGGLTGATAATRYAGATASGHPVTGTFAVGDFTVDQTGSAWVCTGAGSPGTWTQMAGGGGGGGDGSTPFTPVTMAPVQWLLFNTDTGPNRIGAYTYDNGTAGVGATVTANSNGALSFFFEPDNTPSAGDRVLLCDPYADGTGDPPHPDGIYTITSLGSGSAPWVLTRAADHDTAATLGVYWTVTIEQGAIFGSGTGSVAAVTDQQGPLDFVVGTSFPGLAIAAESSFCLSPWSTAYGGSSVALGGQSTAGPGNNATALGNTAAATGQTATAVGAYSNATGQQSTALGYQTAAAAINASALGNASVAYAPGQTATAGGYNNNVGDAQSTETFFSNGTSDATPTLLALPYGFPFRFLDENLNVDYSKTVLLKATVVARRTDTPGTDSAWTAQGVLRGDGSSAYTWVGGTAPVFSVVAQDSGASAWAVAIAIVSDYELTVTVTGAAGKSIDWLCKLDMYEVS